MIGGLAAGVSRTDLGITTTFRADFASNNRMTFLVPAYPVDQFFGVPTAAHPDITDDGVRFLFTPIDDNLIQGAQTITLTANITSTTGYDVLNPQVANLVMADNDVSASTTLGQNAVIGSRDGLFVINLSAPFPINVNVPYTISSTSTELVYGVDYLIPNATQTGKNRFTGKAVIPAGQTQAQIVIQILSSKVLSAPQSFTLNLDGSNDYVLAGNPNGLTGASTSTLVVTNKSLIPPPNPSPNPLVPDVPGSVSNDSSSGSGCGAGGGVALLLGTSLALITTLSHRRKNR
jgi:hypothetical protein